MTSFADGTSSGWQFWTTHAAQVSLSQSAVDIIEDSGRTTIPLSTITYVRANRAYVHGRAHFYLLIEAAGRQHRIAVHDPAAFPNYEAFMRRFVPAVTAAAPEARMEGGVGAIGTVALGVFLVIGILGLLLVGLASVPPRWESGTLVVVACVMALAGTIAVVVQIRRMLRRRRYDGADILTLALPESD